MLYETKIYVSSYLSVLCVCAFAKRNELSKLGIKKGYHHVTEFHCVVAGAAITHPK